jgi:predicted acyltransferase
VQAAVIGNSPKSDAPLLRDDRLVSLDALRGFDMFWIMGGEAIVGAAAALTGWPWLLWLKSELKHPDWDGFALYDLIFPLFLFMAGVAMPLSFEKRLARGDSKASLYEHVIVRGLLLVLLGAVYNGLLKFNWPDIRLPSVLGRIGLAYLFAGLIVLNTGVRAQFVWFVGILVAYWAALKFIPVPEFGAGDLRIGHTLTDFIDRTLIPGRLYHRDVSDTVNIRDPEGLLATIPAIGTALAGAITGQFLKNPRYTGEKKTLVMVATGLVCLGLAWLWNFEFPINKNLWSSSFVLQCAGCSLLLLSLFYLVIDVWRFRASTLPLVVIGSNSILIYMAPRFIDFGYATNSLFGGVLQHTHPYQLLLTAIAVVTVKWLLLYWLYRKRIFLKV